MKILFIADLHCVDYRSWEQFLKIDQSKFDIIATLGDIDISFLQSLQRSFSKQIFGVQGNHDRLGDLDSLGIKNLHNKILQVDDLIFSGIAGCVKYKNKNDTPIYTQNEIQKLCNTLGPSDIIISHNSPYGINDKPDIAHEGYYGLLDYIEKNNPKYCIHGHQHRKLITKYNDTLVICIYGGAILDTITGQIEVVLDVTE